MCVVEKKEAGRTITTQRKCRASRCLSFFDGVFFYRIFGCIIFCIAGCWTTHISAQTLVSDSAQAQTLQKITRFNVMLPQSYGAHNEKDSPNGARRRYPILYLLHGWGGGFQDWAIKSRLFDYLGWYDLIVVMPDAENSWYVNSATNERQRYEDYIAKELPALIAERFAADTARQSIAGLSMGGYGAVALALKYPHRYAVAGAFSGAISMPRDLVKRERANKAALGNNGDFALPSLMAAFGPEGHPSRKEGDIFTLWRRASESASAPKLQNTLPYIYLATGIQDPLAHIASGNREFRDTLFSARAQYEYHETPGSHSWEYWNSALRAFLPRLMEITGWK